MVEKIKWNEILSDAEMLREEIQGEASCLKKEVSSSAERKYKDPDLIEAKKIIEKGWDTNKIKKLTPELVGDLADFYERQGWSLERDKKLLDGKSFLSLNGLKSLDWETANALAFFRWDSLELNWLTNISPKIAWVLSHSKCMNLHLDGLININKEEAKELSNYGWVRLSLSGMKNISRDVAVELGKFRWGVLILDGLVSINKEEAKELSNLESDLRLNWLKKIDKRTAKEFSNIKSSLRLNWLKKIDKETAGELANFRWNELELFWLTGMDEDVVRILSKLWSRLHFTAE